MNLFGRTWLRRYLSIVVLMLLALCGAGAALFFYLTAGFAEAPDLADATWSDATLATDARVEDLLAHMTLWEKVGQMALVEKNSIRSSGDIAFYGLGGLLSGAGAKPATNTAAGWTAMTADFQTEARQSRLGIPLLYGADAVHGHALVPGATVFPHQIGLGATGDAELVKKIAAATAEDLRVTGVNWNYAPNLDLPQDMRWGRVYEAFSDDPILVSRLGAAYVSGLQQMTVGSSSASGVLATLKHYVGLGAMQWNTSTNQNFKIDQAVTVPDMEALRGQYIQPFAAGVEAGALAVMVGLNTWDGKRLIINHDLITRELKEGLDFRGFVVSDWYGVYEGRSDTFLALIEAINAGVDMVMLPFDYDAFVTQMVIANRLGLISTERIDDATRRILRAKFSMGLFDTSERKPRALAAPTLEPHSRLARQAVAQSLVLLKNKNNLLPIRASARTIRVAGSAADNVGMQAGAWTVEWQGVDGNWLANSTSILAGITQRAPSGVTVEYAASGTFARVTKAEIGIAVVGERPYAEGWGDREYPTLSESDRQAIKNLQASCESVVVVIVSGRPLLIEHEIAGIDALVAAWLPGTEGAGVADVLFGDVPFQGTLPLPWPRTSEQLPVTSTGESADGTAVLFPRYFGLSY